MNCADALLDQFESQDVECLFASPIGVMAPIWEALVRREGRTSLRYFRCRHESLAVSLASGFYKASGRGQTIFLPSSLGVQNGSMALSTAFQERTPMTIISLDTLSYGEEAATDPGAEWPSLLVDFAGPARNAEPSVKWAKRARTSSELLREIWRASYLAESIPRGPTLLEVPFELLMAEVGRGAPTPVRATSVVAPGDQIHRVAQILATSTRPVVITEHGGRTHEERDTLVRIAEALCAPVFEFMMPAFHNFPRSHPLYRLGPVEPVLSEADAVLLAGCNAPWHPPLLAMRSGCSVIHVEEDPTRPRAAYWGYPTTHTVPGDLALNLSALAIQLEAGLDDKPNPDRCWFSQPEGAGPTVTADAPVSASQFVTASDLFEELRDSLPDNAICVDEIVVQVPEMIRVLFRDKPFAQFRGWAGALGTGLGTALGVKLARPGQTVVAIIGDGAWHYNPVPAALGFGQEYGVPLLIVVCNNQRYASQAENLMKYFPDSAAVRQQNFVGDLIQPTPDYVKLVEAYGGTGERVQDVGTLRPALLRALHSVACGQSFLLDVIVRP